MSLKLGILAGASALIVAAGATGVTLAAADAGPFANAPVVQAPTRTVVFPPPPPPAPAPPVAPVVKEDDNEPTLDDICRAAFEPSGNPTGEYRPSQDANKDGVTLAERCAELGHDGAQMYLYDGYVPYDYEYSPPPAYVDPSGSGDLDGDGQSCDDWDKDQDGQTQCTDPEDLDPTR